MSNHNQSSFMVNLFSWFQPSQYSVATKNMFMGTLAMLSLGAATAGLGYVAGGLQGLYWSLGLQVGLNLAIVAYCRELVFYMHKIKTVEPGTTVEGFDLHQMAERLMKKSPINMRAKPLIGIMETDVLNALATGPHPGYAGIAVTRGILKEAKRYAEKTPYTAEQLIEAVLAHELGHVVHRDIAIGALTSVLSAAVKALNNKVYTEKFSNRHKVAKTASKADEKQQDKSEQLGSKKTVKKPTVDNPWLYFFIGWTLPFLVKLTGSFISRRKETHADEMAFRCGYGKIMQHSLRMLGQQTANVKNKTPQEIKKLVDELEGNDHSLFCVHHANDASKKGSGLFYNISKALRTHPPIDERIEHLQALEREATRARVS